jgi:hypothetical protein
MSTQPKPSLPLTQKDIEDFVQAIKDDLGQAKGRPAIQSWMNRMAAQNKSDAANGFFNQHRDAIDAIFLSHKNAA